MPQNTGMSQPVCMGCMCGSRACALHKIMTRPSSGVVLVASITSDTHSQQQLQGMNSTKTKSFKHKASPKLAVKPTERRRT
jgi:hypothetical protein